MKAEMESVVEMERRHKREMAKLRSDVRAAFAEYVCTEGCSCCQDTDGHQAAAIKIGKLLRVKKYADGSGYDFYQYDMRGKDNG